MSEWPQILFDIDRKLFPHFELTTYQRVLYHHLIASTFAQDQSEVTLTIPQLSEAIAASEFTARKAIRELSEKGIVDATQTRRGYKITPKLPEHLDLPDTGSDTPLIDVEEVDFFNGRKFLEPLMDRESGKCFYCLSNISTENCELDHVVSQLEHGSNGYRNIVAACHNCNTRKQAMAAADFLRNLYRRGLLSEDEVAERLSALEQLQNGELVPDIRHVPV